MQEKERLHKAISYLKGEQIISTHQDVIDRIKMNKSSFSLAFNGNEKYLTKKFLKRFNESFEGIFNYEWLLTGKGEMLKSDKGNTSDNLNVEPLTNDDAMTVSMLTQMLFDSQKEVKELKAKISELENENSALRNGTEKKESLAG